MNVVHRVAVTADIARWEPDDVVSVNCVDGWWRANRPEPALAHPDMIRIAGRPAANI